MGRRPEACCLERGAGPGMHSFGHGHALLVRTSVIQIFKASCACSSCAILREWTDESRRQLGETGALVRLPAIVCRLSLCVSAQRSQSACPSSGSVSVASELIVGSELYLGNKARSALERVRVRTRASTSAQSSVLSASARASAACHHRWAWDAGVPAGA